MIQLENLLSNAHVSAYCKDKKGAYLEVNHSFLKCSRTTSFTEVLGNSDLDLIWKTDAHRMMENDQAVIKNDCRKIVIEKATLKSGTDYYLSHKTALRSKLSNKIIGVFGISYLINTTSGIPADVLNFCDDERLRANLKEKFILVNANKYGLSAQQAKCLMYLVKGNKIKQIAQIMQLSPRTVGHYLEAVKPKLNCNSTSELIAKAFELFF